MFKIGRPLEDPVKRFWKYVDRSSSNECWLWKGGVTNRGYGKFYDGEVTVGAHRFSWEISRKCSVPEGKFILHLCDNPLCVNPDHLYYGMQSDNMKDRFKRDRVDLSSCAQPILYEGEVWLIKKLYNAGISQSKIALMFKVSQSTISRWISGEFKYAKPNPE